MKLKNKDCAGMKFTNDLVADENGVVEVKDEAMIAALQKSGFKPLFGKKEEKPIEEAKPVAPVAEKPVEAKPEVKPEPVIEKKKGKFGRK